MEHLGQFICSATALESLHTCVDLPAGTTGAALRQTNQFADREIGWDGHSLICGLQPKLETNDEAGWQTCWQVED